MRKLKPLKALVAILALLIAAFPAYPARAEEHFLQLSGMDIYNGWEFAQTSVQPGSHTIDRFTVQFRFTFFDRLDPTSVAPNVTVTGPDGSPVTWRLESEPGTPSFSLYPPGLLPVDTLYTIRIEGGPDGIKSADGAPMKDHAIYALTTDNTKFELHALYQIGGDNAGELGDGAVLGRNADELWVEFTHPIDEASARQAIRVTRQDGSDAGWQVKVVQHSRVIFVWGEWLPRVDERYTITIAGGADGIRDVAGQQFDQNVSRTLHTIPEPYYFVYRFPTNWSTYGTLQNDLYEFRAEAGVFRVDLTGDIEPMIVPVLFAANVDQTPHLFLKYVLVNGQQGLEYNIGTGGVHRLYVMKHRLTQIALGGWELQVHPATPAISLPPLEPFTIADTPFTYEGVVRNPADTGLVGIYLDAMRLGVGKPDADGEFGPVTVDTTGLPDGVYYLDVMAEAAASENVAYRSTPLLVDRVRSFPDVSADHWARRYIEAMHDLGVINGRDDGRFAPGDPVTRAEFAKLLAATLGLEYDPGTMPNPFADVPSGHWAEPYIRTLYAYGLITGDVVGGQRYFYPDRTVSRAEAATMIARAMRLSEIPAEGAPFGDWAQVPAWAKPSVLALSLLGWLNGYPDGNYHPFDPLLRDQSAKILAQFYTE